MTQVETNISIRPLSGDDIPLMETFLYEAIFVPEGVTKPPREIILQPELAIYVRGFGKCVGDHGVVAEINSEIVGMAWTRNRHSIIRATIGEAARSGLCGSITFCATGKSCVASV